ncbi:MAG TPA: substrate-binding domain-containing protein [Chthoniobacteraceae bacterium]|nr:substrate-binding domain-containing protein [Chthoniobacteraceae bacterium]
MAAYLHERLTRTLLEEMASGMYCNGQHFLSMRTIGRLWKVSEPTVTASLRSLVGKGLLRAAPRRGFFLRAGFQQKAQMLLRRNRIAPLEPPITLQQKVRLLQNIKGGKVAVLLETAQEPSLEEHREIPSRVTPSVRRCANAFEEESRKYGFESRWFLYDGSAATLQWMRERLEAGGFQGAAVFCRSSHEIVRPMLEPLISQHLPVVIMYDDCRGLPVNSINLNNVGIGYDAIRHLYKLGHRKITVLSESVQGKVSTARLKGCLLAQSEGGCRDAKLAFFKCSENPTSGKLVRHFANPATRPTAVFTCESRSLRRVFGLWRRLGLSVPDDLSVIMCSSRATHREVEIPIDSMNLKVGRKVGRLAAQHLHKIQAGEPLEKSVLIDIAYVKRGSVRALERGK